MADDALVAFDRDQRRRGLRDATIVSRRRVLRALETHLGGPLLDADQDEIESWVYGLRLSDRSRYTYIGAVASFFEFARRRGLREDDPTRDIVRPRLKRLLPRPASPDDIAYAIGAAEPKMAAWLSLGVFQGLRCFEIAQVRREDLLLDQTPPKLVIANGKGGRQDIMSLNEAAELALRNYGLPRSGFLFIARTGQPYRPASVSSAISRYLRSIGIDATAHRLRHLFITSVWEQTHDLRVTQETARHSSPTTTAGYAAHDKDVASKVVRSLRLPGHRQREQLDFPK